MNKVLFKLKKCSSKIDPLGSQIILICGVILMSFQIGCEVSDDFDLAEMGMETTFPFGGGQINP